MSEAQQQVSKAPYVLFKAIGTGTNGTGHTEFGEMQKVGDVMPIEGAKFESYKVTTESGEELVIDKSKAGDYFLKAKNPTYDENKPADFKTNSRYNIVTQLYKTLNKAGDSVYFRGTIGPKDKPTERVVWRMFKNTPKSN